MQRGPAMSKSNLFTLLTLNLPSSDILHDAVTSSTRRSAFVALKIVPLPHSHPSLPLLQDLYPHAPPHLPLYSHDTAL